MNQLIRIIFTAAIITSIAACGNRNSSSKKTDSATEEVSLQDKEFELLQHPTKEMLYGRWRSDNAEYIISPTGIKYLVWVQEIPDWYNEAYYAQTGIKYLTLEQKESVAELPEPYEFEIISYERLVENGYATKIEKYIGVDFICISDKEWGDDRGCLIMDVSKMILEEWDGGDPMREVGRYIKVNE